MCTLIALHRCVPGAPLVIAANRDEYLDRPSEGPGVWQAGATAIAAPRDLRAGGTWQGLSAQGVFAAVTNRRCPEPDPARRSRGLVVVDALQEASAADAARRLEQLPRDAFNPFNALVADRREAFVLTYEGTVRVRRLAPGPHVIGNVEPDDRSVPKVRRVLERAEEAARKPAHEALAALADACREHADGEPSLEDTCVHLGGYGTRSSTLLTLAEAPEHDRLTVADGAPCRADYEDFTPLLRELSHRARYADGDIATRKVP